MGSPRRLRKKYETPMHPWRREVLEVERVLKKDYSLKNKRELWKINSTLRGFKNQAKKLIAAQSAQAEKERSQLMGRLRNIGLITENSKLDDVLGLTINNILDRRLQSLVNKHGLANSMGQARQFIVHGHIIVGDRKVAAPSYIVRRSEEMLIKFAPGSQFSNPEHAMRISKKQNTPASIAKAAARKAKLEAAARHGGPRRDNKRKGGA